MCVYMCVCMDVCVYVCACLCVCMCVCICVYAVGAINIKWHYMIVVVTVSIPGNTYLRLISQLAHFFNVIVTVLVFITI